MKSYVLTFGVVIAALVIALIAWRGTAGRHEAEPDIDFVMDRLAEDAVKEAQEKYSVALDYSPGSVAKVDAILASLHAQYVKKHLDDRTVRRQSHLWGAYLGGVIKKVRPAHWAVDSEFIGKGTLPLIFGPKDQTFPCSWTYKRIVNGDEDNIVFKYQICITDRGKPQKGVSFSKSSP